MSQRLWEIIQKHLDDYGVREAEFARRIGTSPQTVSSWKKRGLRTLPDKKLLVGVSEVTRRSYDEILDAVLHDIRYLPKDVGIDDRSTATSQAPESGATVTPLPSAKALDPTMPDDVAARSEQGKGTTQSARERQDREGES